MLPSSLSTSRPAAAPLHRELRDGYVASPKPSSSPSSSATAAAPAAQPIKRESIGSILAKNLVVARIAAGMTQHELAGSADISRATIAQLEAGTSDPRLSTVVDLAGAMQISPLLLLIGTAEVNALLALREGPTEATADIDVRPDDVERMNHYTASGFLKDRVRAARIGAGAARLAKRGQSSIIAAALFSPIRPGPGTRLGATLGALLSGQ